MAAVSPVKTVLQTSGSASANQGKDKSFWNLLQLDHTSLDKEIDIAAVRAFQCLHYGQHGRPRPQGDIEQINSKTTVDSSSVGKRSRSNPDETRTRSHNTDGKSSRPHIEDVTDSKSQESVECAKQLQSNGVQDEPNKSRSGASVGKSSKIRSHQKEIPTQRTSSRKQRTQQRSHTNHSSHNNHGNTGPVQNGTKIQPDKTQLDESGKCESSSDVDQQQKQKVVKPRTHPSKDMPKGIKPEMDQVKGQSIQEVQVSNGGLVDPGAKDGLSVTQPAVSPGVDKAEVPSTLPTEAKLQFLWAKTIPTKVTCVKLKVNKIKTMIPLHYVAPKDIYLSEEITLPCANYTCSLLVAGTQYNTEPVDIRHYTFEVDLYIEEEEDSTQNASPSLTSKRPSQISRSEVTVKRSEVILETRSRSKSTPGERDDFVKVESRRPPVVPLPVGQHTKLSAALPVGEGRDKRRNIATKVRNMEDVMEHDDKGIRHSNRLEKLLRQQMGDRDKNDSPKPSDKSSSHGDHTDQALTGSIDRLQKTFCDGFKPVSDSTTLGSKYSIASSEQELSKYLSVPESHSSADYSGHVSMASNGSLGRSRSVGSLDNNTDNSTYRSNGNQDQSESASDKETRYHSNYNHSHTRNSIATSTPTGIQNLPVDFQVSHDRDYHSDDYMASNRTTPVIPGSADYRRESGYMESTHRASSNTDQAVTYQPSIRSPLITARTTISSRGQTELEPQKIQELQRNMASLNRTLDDRDKQLQASTRERSELSEELQRLRQVYETPTEGRDEKEKRINQLIREKENLATEVWKLKRNLEDKPSDTGSKTPVPDSTGDLQPASEPSINGYHDNHLDHYKPNNPQALQRKLEDLESQLQDLNEAHETTVTKLSASEREIGALTEENKSLRSGREREMDKENIHLREQLRHLQEDDGDYLQRELAQVKQELHTLRDRNHQLMEDNIKLTEHLKYVDTSDATRGSHLARNRHRSPGYHSKCDPLLDSDHTSWPQPSSIKLDDDEQFSQDRQRLTQELRQMVPPKWSDRDFRNHGDEGPFIRSANQDPFTRARSTSPTRHTDIRTDISMGPDMSDRRSKGNPDTKHQDTLLDDRISDRVDGRHYESLRDESSRQHQRDDLVRRARSRSPEQHHVNGYHERVTSSRHERHLSGHSDTTVDLTHASPLGAGREHSGGTHELDNDFGHGHESQPADLRLASAMIEPKHLKHDLHLHSLPPVHYDQIDDVMDSLTHPSSTRCRLKVDLLDDVLDETKSSVIHKQSRSTLFNNPISLDMTTMARETYHSPGIQRHQSPGGSKLDQLVSPSGEHLRLDTSNHSSLVEDLLDVSMDDPSYSRCLLQGVSNDTPGYGRYLRDAILDDSSCIRRKRRDSVDSTSTEAILSAIDEDIRELDFDKRKAASDALGGSTSLRSVSPHPIITQHNKGTLASSISARESRHSYANKRPFAPRTPADVNIGDVVKFCRQGGKISKGLVKYVGHLPGKHDSYLGLELEHEMAKHDGIYEGVRYFQSKANRGVFVAFSKVVMAWGE